MYYNIIINYFFSLLSYLERACSYFNMNINVSILSLFIIIIENNKTNDYACKHNNTEFFQECKFVAQQVFMRHVFSYATIL